MTAAVQQLLSTFDALPAPEKHDAVVEILRRFGAAAGDLPEESLLAAADELFLALDVEEAGHAAR
jgi:hypothetical protein